MVNTTVNTITYYSGSVASMTGCSYAKFGLYTFNEATGALVLVAATASVTTVFSATSTAYSLTFSTANSLPSSYTLQAGSRYAITYVVVYTGGSFSLMQYTPSATYISALAPRICTLYTSGQTTLPTTFSVSSGSNFASLVCGRVSFV